MSHKMLRPFIVKVSVLGYFPLLHDDFFIILSSTSEVQLFDLIHN